MTTTLSSKMILEISKRGREIQGSPIRKLAAIAEERKKQGIHVYHLNIGQPDLPTPQAVFDAIKSISLKTIEYAPSNGISSTLKAWKKYFEYYGISYNENELLITTGGSEAIVFAMASVCDFDDEIIVFEPFYTNYNGFASIANVRLKSIPLTIENGFHLPSESEIEKFISKRTKAILICNPSNPTGTVYTRDEVQRIVNLSEKHGLFILSDEAYRDFIYEGEMISIADFPSIRDRAILLDSCSKRFNVCGLRVGVLATHNQHVLTAALKFAQARLSVATIDQLSVIPLLEDPGKYAKPIVEEFRHRRDVVCAGLSKIPGVKFHKPEGAFYMIMGLPIKDSEDFCKWLIEKFDHNKETVLVAPAQGFYGMQGKGMNEVRLAYVLDSSKLEKALEILRLAIESYNKGR